LHREVSLAPPAPIGRASDDGLGGGVMLYDIERRGFGLVLVREFLHLLEREFVEDMTKSNHATYLEKF
jgi:hypothetical protein